MFEAKPQRTMPNDLVAAASGFSLMSFAPDPTIKPSVLTLNEYISANTHPVVLWKMKGGHAEPITFAPLKDAAAPRFIFHAGKIYELGGGIWSNYEQFVQALLQRWMIARGVKEPKPQPPRQVVLGPDQTAVISRSPGGFF
jgi:hypothetical protein